MFVRPSVYHSLNYEYHYDSQTCSTLSTDEKVYKFYSENVKEIHKQGNLELINWFENTSHTN
jgi:hypothetical protein